MNDVEQWGLEPYYLNVRRVTMLAGAPAVSAALASVSGRGMSPKLQETIELWAARDVFLRWLSAHRDAVEPFEVLRGRNGLSRGVIFSTFKDLYCRDLRVIRTGNEPAMHANFDFEQRVVLRLLPNLTHVAPGSPGDLLRGHTGELFIVAVTESVSDAEVVAVPIFIGLRLRDAQGGMFSALHGDSLEVHPDDIEAFARIKDEDIPSRAQLKVLRSIPEEDIKRALAGLVGEPSVPKDWGGERSDLFSSRVTVGGRRLSTAFLFKGPGGGFEPMTFRHLGKNGDQVDRLFTEPADLLVLQHCHEVRAAVRGMMRAYANQLGNPRRYCIIDGYDTVKILRAYALCGQSHVPRRERRPVDYADEPELEDAVDE